MFGYKIDSPEPPPPMMNTIEEKTVRYLPFTINGGDIYLRADKIIGFISKEGAKVSILLENEEYEVDNSIEEVIEIIKK